MCDHGLAAIFVLTAMTSSSANIPSALDVKFPLAYMQSSFVTGHSDGVDCPGQGIMWQTLTSEERLDRLRRYALNSTSFRGGEMFINTMETAAARADVREMNRLILQVAEETKTGPFYGFWIPSRIPGMWWPANYSTQPDSYRAKALMSNGKPWVQYPTGCATSTSILNLQGTDLDITNTEVVSLAMQNLGQVLRADCYPTTDCVGPLVGSYLFSEAALTPPYMPFSTFPYSTKDAPQFGNVSDLQPPGIDGQPPLLRMGNATLLYSDDKVVFSFYQGPKRTAPLFSLSARDSFAKYCTSRGHPNVTTLPADRNEFNDDDHLVSLPPHVKFVPLSDTELWSLWEDWVMQTWFDYCAVTIATVNAAQAENPYFGGAFYFQLAGWYSIRGRAKRPVTYQWRDFNDTLREQVDEVVAQWPNYDDMNPVVKGQDLEMFANASWLSGWIHEASHGVPMIGVHPPMLTPREVRDRYIMASDRHHHFVNAQGTMAREIMESRDKIFGAFSRAAFISDPTYRGPSVADTLTVPGFAQMWNYSTALLKPKIVATLGDFRFVRLSDAATPPLHDVFEQLFRELNTTACH